MTRETRRDEGSRLRRGREPRQLARRWMMMKSQDFRDNKVVVLKRGRLAKALLSEGCHNKAEAHLDQTDPLQHDRKLKRWNQTTPLTRVMRLLRENLPHLKENPHKANLLQANLHKANLLQAKVRQANLLQEKVRQAASPPNKANLPGKVHKTINKANLKGLIQNVSKLRLP